MKVNEINKYGITLIPLTVNDIEVLRCWRNDPKISQYMGTQQYITPEAQLDWFQSIKDAVDGVYFIVHFKHEAIGYVCLKNIDYINKCGEPGMFIYNDKYINTSIAYNIIFALIDYCFEKINLHYLNIHILCTNNRARRFNKSFGAKLQPGQEKEFNQLYKLEKDDYFSSRTQYMQIVSRIYKQ